MDRQRRVAIPAGVIAVAISLSAAAVRGAADDASVQRRIEARLQKARLDRYGDVRVSLEDGHVVLSGFVTSVYAQRQAERLARKESKSVESRLRVVPEQRSDAELRKAVQEAIVGYARYGVFDSAEMGVEDGRVLLRGSVLQPHRKQAIEDRVSKVPGVRAVESEIRVQPVSAFDDRLRLQLYQAIYGDERFVHWANRPDPPVRIIVENGRVTLTGYVGSAVEQALLGHIARSVLAFGVDNRVRLESERTKEPSKPSSD